MPQVDLKVSHCQLFQLLHQPADRGEVVIEGVGSRCRSVLEVFEADLTAPEGLARPALTQCEKHSAVFHTDHSLGFGEPVAPEADRRKKRRCSTAYIEVTVNQKRILARHSKVGIKEGA